MQTIDLEQLETVTGGARVNPRHARTAMRTAGRVFEKVNNAMNVIGTVAFVAELGQMGYQGIKGVYDWAKGRNQPAAPTPPAQPIQE